nr:hypothetical protein [Tanacetum cinerariifolium]
MNEYKGIMMTKIELTLEQLQQGVSNDALGFAAALAVLITRASQSRQHGKSQPLSLLYLSKWGCYIVQRHTQEEGIEYDEVFVPVARIEAIRLFLAYASFNDFVVYQMDVKIAFLYRKIEKEVYVCQPPGCEDLNIPNKVYKVKKALYGLHQAPRAWYETLPTYLLDNGFQRGKNHKTIFIKRHKEVKNASTPMETQKPQLKNEDGEDVDVHMYTSMIRSLMYLTSSRLDIMFVVCACARYQVNPNVSHLHAVKRIFRYLKGQPKLGLWYPKGSPFDLVAYIDSDYAGASLDRKSTIGGIINVMLIVKIAMDCTWFLDYHILGKAKKSLTGAMQNNSGLLQWLKPSMGEAQIHARVDGQKVVITEASIRRDL